MLQSHLLLVVAFVLSKAGPGLPLSGSAGAPAAAAAALPVLALALGLYIAGDARARLSAARGDLAAELRSAARSLFLFRVAVAGLYLLLVHNAGWGLASAQAVSGAPFLSDALMILPYWAAAVAAETCAGAALADRPGGLAAAILGEARTLAVASAAVVLLSGLAGLPWRGIPREFPAAGLGAAAAAAAAIAVFFPFVARAMWSLRPAGEIDAHADLRGLAARAGFRFSGMYFWDAPGRMLVNAAVTGLLARPRYIMVTRGLVERLGRDEVKMVLAHEIGHVSGRHGAFMLCAAFAWAAVSISIYGASGLQGATLLAFAASPAAVFAPFMVVAARTFEKEADLFAAGLSGDPPAYAKTIEKVAVLNGGTRDSGSISHPSAGSRADFVKAAAADESFRGRFRLAVRALKAAAVVFALAGAASAVPLVGRHMGGQAQGPGGGSGGLSGRPDACGNTGFASASSCRRPA